MPEHTLIDNSLEVIEITDGIFSDWASIFNTYNFFRLLKTGKSYYFALKDNASDKTLGVCHFSELEPGVYRSPYRGTFGGFELQENNIDHLVYFAEKVENKLIEKGAREIIISDAAFNHNSVKSTMLFNILLNRDYVISNHDINYDIKVDAVGMIEKMNRNNKKRLKKCEREGMIFQQAFDKEMQKEVYETLKTNRESKGYVLSMSYDEIVEMKNVFNESIFFFSVTFNENVIASSICIRINKNILYAFYWGDIPGYEEYSAVSFLANGIYEFCRENNYSMLDAGTSTIKGVPIFNLIKFKENLGFTGSLKLTYTKHLAP